MSLTLTSFLNFFKINSTIIKKMENFFFKLPKKFLKFAVSFPKFVAGAGIEPATFRL